MHRGEVWWADLPLPYGRRPAVLLSRDIAYNLRTSVTVGPVTRTIRGIPVEVELDQADGMPARCVVNLDDIMTVPKSALSGRITQLSAERLAAVGRAIAFALDLEV